MLCCVLLCLTLQPATKPPYRDLPVVQELANMLKVAQKAAVAAPLVSDESKKWLSWDEYLDWVRKLHAECAGNVQSSRVVIGLFVCMCLCVVVADPQLACADLTPGFSVNILNTKSRTPG